MVRLRKLSSKITISLAVLLCLLLTIACSKKEKSNLLVAKVNDAVLTVDDLNIALSQNRNNGKYREEYIQSWIEKEVLSQQAAKKGVQDEREFKFISELNKKELAVAMFINKILDENKIEITDDEIKDYYDNNKEDFRLSENAFVLNKILFNDFDKAVQFRNNVLNSDWDKALNVFNGEQSIVESSVQKLYCQYQVQPVSLLRIVNNMDIGETSIVFETEPMKYAVVQMISKYDSNSVPSIDIIREKIKERLAAIKQKEFLKNYIDKLISEHNTEVVRYSE